ncbi:Plant self-incompatibility S1 [Macleaya cordata]|uniref:Plant self-incompatibility S1 n=1 Tax=Macleaya cordata TaxID=56857 RepID=A0A200PYM7_MACCD|nr:Plant self-incompatibility S1 [Macleaya cordata]
MSIGLKMKSSSTSSHGALYIIKVHVHIKDDIDDGNLSIYCKSKDNTLPERNLTYGSTYDINFKVALKYTRLIETVIYAAETTSATGPYVKMVCIG